jgi:hypothetical protein
LCFAFSAYGKAGKYEQAYSAYLERRLQLETQMSQGDRRAD